MEMDPGAFFKIKIQFKNLIKDAFFPTFSDFFPGTLAFVTVSNWKKEINDNFNFFVIFWASKSWSGSRYKNLLDMLDPDQIFIFESATLVRISESMASIKVNKKLRSNPHGALINCSSEQTGKCIYR
jgi:hypothetical protein